MKLTIALLSIGPETLLVGKDLWDKRNYFTSKNLALNIGGLKIDL
jgi:hypothetical protein